VTSLHDDDEDVLLTKSVQDYDDISCKNSVKCSVSDRVWPTVSFYCLLVLACIADYRGKSCLNVTIKAFVGCLDSTLGPWNATIYEPFEREW